MDIWVHLADEQLDVTPFKALFKELELEEPAQPSIIAKRYPEGMIHVSSGEGKDPQPLGVIIDKVVPSEDNAIRVFWQLPAEPDRSNEFDWDPCSEAELQLARLVGARLGPLLKYILLSDGRICTDGLSFKGGSNEFLRKAINEGDMTSGCLASRRFRLISQLASELPWDKRSKSPPSAKSTDVGDEAEGQQAPIGRIGFLMGPTLSAADEEVRRLLKNLLTTGDASAYRTNRFARIPATFSITQISCDPITEFKMENFPEISRFVFVGSPMTFTQVLKLGKVRQDIMLPFEVLVALKILDWAPCLVYENEELANVLRIQRLTVQASKVAEPASMAAILAKTGGRALQPLFRKGMIDLAIERFERQRKAVVEQDGEENHELLKGKIGIASDYSGR